MLMANLPDRDITFKKELTDVLAALGIGRVRRFFHRDGAAMERADVYGRLSSMEGNAVAQSMLWALKSRDPPIDVDKYRIIMEHDGKYRAVRVYGFFTD